MDLSPNKLFYYLFHFIPLIQLRKISGSRWRSTESEIHLAPGDNNYNPNDDAHIRAKHPSWTFYLLHRYPRLLGHHHPPILTHGISTRSAIPCSSSILHPLPIYTSHLLDHIGMLSALPLVYLSTHPRRARWSKR
jgi:hypothetical protein